MVYTNQVEHQIEYYWSNLKIIILDSQELKYNNQEY